MKKLFGNIDLSWKKLIIFAIVIAIYTAIMALIPITKDTSFRDIAINFEWWILFGIIIIANSKTPKESALKCFVFFLISQPLIYLIQVPFSSQGWGLFNYYKYWFLWTLACLPMGYIGYYINKKNIISILILLPMLLLLSYLGCNYFTSMMNNFPYHLLSFLVCFIMIIVITLNMFDKNKLKIITLLIVTILTIIYIVLKGGIVHSEFETYKSLDDYDISFEGKIKVIDYKGSKNGKVEVVSSTDEVHSIKIKGKNNEKYEFTITDESNNKYKFEYYYKEDNKSIVLNRKD